MTTLGADDIINALSKFGKFFAKFSCKYSKTSPTAHHRLLFWWQSAQLKHRPKIGVGGVTELISIAYLDTRQIDIFCKAYYLKFKGWSDVNLAKQKFVNQCLQLSNTHLKH